MKRVLFVLQLLLLMGVCSNAQKLAFDSKYVKVGVMSNEWPSCMANNPNLRKLGTFKGESFDENKIGKEILDILYERDANGSLHRDKMESQALQNVTLDEQEVAKKDESAEDKKDILRREISHQFLMNNYIIKFTTTKTKKGKEKKYWYAYHVEINDRIIEQAYSNWEKEDAATYDQINVSIKLVAHGKVPMKSKDENELIYKIAKKVPAFAVRGPLSSRFPLVARDMGRNLAMKKASRIYIYDMVGNPPNMYSKKVCTARATQVSETTTRMHMISGTFPSVGKGEVAVLKDRHRSSISLLGQASFGDDARYGGQLQYDYLLDFSKGGIAQYAMLNVGANRYTKEKEGVWWNSVSEEPVQPVLNHVEAQIGYGIGFNLLGRIEILPYIMGGYQLSYVTNKGEWHDKEGVPEWHDEATPGLVYWDNSVGQQGDWQKMTESTGHSLVGYAGAKLNVNLWYPLQLSVGADYNYSFGSTKLLKYIRDRHVLNRVNIYAGFRLHF